jgi:hypothetical protein
LAVGPQLQGSAAGLHVGLYLWWQPLSNRCAIDPNTQSRQ